MSPNANLFGGAALLAELGAQSGLSVLVGRARGLTGRSGFRAPLFPITPILGFGIAAAFVAADWHDREAGRRPIEELFDTFLHEVAHHLEYTEPDRFDGRTCGRVPGRMHSHLFWRILGELKARWADLQRRA